MAYDWFRGKSCRELTVTRTKRDALYRKQIAVRAIAERGGDESVQIRKRKPKGYAVLICKRGRKRRK